MKDRPNLFLSAALSTADQRARNLEFTKCIGDAARVYLPQRDGGLLIDMLSEGMDWMTASRLVREHDVAALRASNILLAILGETLVGAGVAFELGVATALEIPCWGLILAGDGRARSPLIEITLARTFVSIDCVVEDLRRWTP